MTKGTEFWGRSRKGIEEPAIDKQRQVTQSNSSNTPRIRMTMDDSQITRDKTKTERQQSTSGIAGNGWPKHDNFSRARSEAYKQAWSGKGRREDEARANEGRSSSRGR